jgi:serine/threonine-protein kinase HipA
MMIAEGGRIPGRDHIFREAANAGVPASESSLIHESVKAAVWQWPRFAETAGLSEQRTAEIDYVLNRRGRKPSKEVETTVTSSP